MVGEFLLESAAGYLRRSLKVEGEWIRGWYEGQALATFCAARQLAGDDGWPTFEAWRDSVLKAT